MLETDEGEISAVTVLKIDAAVLRKFVGANKFDTIKDPASYKIYSNGSLFQYKAEFSAGEEVYRLQGPMNKYHWELVADVRNNTLWMEHFYPPGEGLASKSTKK